MTWLSWAVFESPESALSRADHVKILRLVSELQFRLDHVFPRRFPGQAKLECMRFSIEPVRFFPKPLTFYSICAALGSGACPHAT